MNRLTVFIDPDNADSDDAYNLQQSLIAVGSGGFFGKGLGHATQSAGGFLPEFHTDFVFAFLSETFGFCGSFLLLCLYVLLIFSTIRVAFKCESLFLRLSCVASSACGVPDLREHRHVHWHDADYRYSAAVH